MINNNTNKKTIKWKWVQVIKYVHYYYCPYHTQLQHKTQSENNSNNLIILEREMAQGRCYFTSGTTRHVKVEMDCERIDGFEP